MASQTETRRISFSSISQALEQGIAGADPARAVGLLGLHRVRAAKTQGMERSRHGLVKNWVHGIPVCSRSTGTSS